jgi:uncharacterized coiled-coil protein SlyX
MKLFFCDICNESIPLQDIKDNRATTIKGKIFCRNCNPLNELASDGPPGAGGRGADAPRGGSGGTALLAVGMLASLGLGGYAVWSQQTTGADQQGRLAGRIDDFESRVADQRNLLNSLSSNVENLQALRGMEKDLALLREDAARRGGEIEKLALGLEAAEKSLNTVGSLRERLDAATLRQEEYGRALDRIEATLAGLDETLREVADRPAVVVAAPTGGDAEAEAAEAVDPELDARWNGLVEKLKNAEEMVRWEAIDQIRREKAKPLLPHVVKLLADRSLFVRAQAIYTLGELKATEAIAPLIKALRDEDEMIRAEALTALVEITGQNIRFDVSRKDKAELDRGIKRWEEWYAKNKDAM